MTTTHPVPRRIAIVSDAIAPYHAGGKETRLFELSTRLAALGFDVHIYTMHWWSSPSKHRLENGVHLHAISPLYPLYNGERRSIRQGILFGVACFRLLFVKFDVVDVDHMPYFPLYTMRIVAWLKRKPMLATWHEVWGKNYWQHYLGKAGWFGSVIEQASILLPGKIIAVSPFTQARLESEMTFSRRAELVTNGINLKTIRGIRRSETTSDIIFAGRLNEHKHVDLLLRAIAKLKPSRPDIRCIIIGEGPELAHLKSLCGRLGLAGNVQFLGFIEQHTTVYALMKASRVFVLPSTREGFGVSVIEANACGIPVVTINHPANAARELITPTTGRLARATAADLATQIDALLKVAAPAVAIRRAASQYDWELSSKTLAEVYS